MPSSTPASIWRTVDARRAHLDDAWGQCGEQLVRRRRRSSENQPPSPSTSRWAPLRWLSRQPRRHTSECALSLAGEPDVSAVCHDCCPRDRENRRGTAGGEASDEASRSGCEQSYAYLAGDTAGLSHCRRLPGQVVRLLKRDIGLLQAEEGRVHTATLNRPVHQGSHRGPVAENAIPDVTSPPPVATNFGGESSLVTVVSPGGPSDASR